MISLKPVQLPKIKVEIKLGTVYVNESNHHSKDLCNSFFIRKNTKELWERNKVY